MKNQRLLNQFKLWLLLVTTCLFAVNSAHADSMDKETISKPDKYEGITITVNINQANADELATLLLGIGASKAQNIVEYREQHGKFLSADDLVKVKGIGHSTVDKNRDRILL